MTERIGSDYGSASVAGITSDRGDALISADTEGSTSLLFGPAALREIQAGVANGDFSMPPDAALDAITTDNPIPYWTVAAAGTTITAAMASAVTAAGQSVTFTAAAGAASTDSITFTRYVPIAGNANRNTAYQGELYAITGTGTAIDRQRVRVTLSITSTDKDLAALTVSSSRFDVANNLNNKSLTTGWITPDATASFLLVTVAISIPTTSLAAAVTIPICEVRLNRGDSTVAFPNATDPTHSTWVINGADNATSDSQLLISNVADNSGTYPSVALVKGTSSASVQINANDGGTIELTTGVGGSLTHTGDQVTFNNSSPLSGGAFTVNMNGSSGGIGTIDLTGTTAVTGALSATGNITTPGTVFAGAVDTPFIRSDNTTTSDLLMQATGADFIMQDMNAADGTNPRILLRARDNTYYAGIKSGAVGVVQILSGSATTTYGQIWAARIYPMNGATASRYFFDDGTRLASSGGFDANGTIYASGAMVSDAISTTTQTASAAIWVLSSGTTYSLRRNSSSARYKTNIVDADEAVLEAARKIKPRHYESTIADESGATRLGFIAEEVEAAGLTHAVGYDAEGRPESLDATALIAALFARVNDLEERLAQLEAR